MEEVWTIKACRRNPAKSGLRPLRGGVFCSWGSSLRYLNFRCSDKGPVMLRTQPDLWCGGAGWLVTLKRRWNKADSRSIGKTCKLRLTSITVTNTLLSWSSTVGVMLQENDTKERFRPLLLPLGFQCLTTAPAAWNLTAGKEEMYFAEPQSRITK